VPGPDRKERERQAREQAIVAAARRIAETHGWEAVTTRRLAAEIEYSQPVLYGHFAGRLEIIAAVARQGFAELTAALAEARAAAPGGGPALLAVARAYDAFAARSPALYDAMFMRPAGPRSAAQGDPGPLRWVLAELEAAVAPFSGASPALHAETLWSALHGACALHRYQRLDPRRQDERLWLIVSLFTAVDRPAPRAPALR
jgi:AcrR family transcriptional regulator